MKLTRLAFSLALAAALAVGCKDEKKHNDHDGHDHSKDKKPVADGGKKDGDHANAITLGETTVAGLKIKALQDEPVKAGGEGAFDLQITGYPAGQKPKAVRFWVGTESGEGSVKAKAEEEKPDNWHTHAEVPNPIPAGAKFWAEIEPATGAKFNVSFDMK
jgi:hypothetical protein